MADVAEYVLRVDESGAAGAVAASGAVRLVAKYCASAAASTSSTSSSSSAKFSLRVEPNAQPAGAPVLSSPDGFEITGVCTVARAIVANSGEDVARQLLGDSPSRVAEIAQWLSLCTEFARLKSAKMAAEEGGKLAAVNAYLLSRVTLAPPGITLADILAYATLHPIMAILSPENKQRLCNLSRWFDFVQSTLQTADMFLQVPFPKPKFTPPPVVEAPSPAAKPAAAAASAQAKPSAPDSSASTASQQPQQPQQQPSKKESKKKEGKEKKAAANGPAPT
eukprot:jgi/Chlat1/5408/Chrsp35S05310